MEHLAGDDIVARAERPIRRDVITSVVGIRPNVENSCPVPSPKARTISATMISDETTRPKPGRLLAARVKAGLPEDEHGDEEQEREPVRLLVPEEPGEDRRGAVVDLAQQRARVEREADAVRSSPMRTATLPMRSRSWRSGERTRNAGRAWRMSPTGAGGSRSGASSVARGLVATETLILLGGRRIPAFVDLVEAGLRRHVGRSRPRARPGRSGAAAAPARSEPRGAPGDVVGKAGRCRGNRHGSRSARATA